MRKRRLEQEDDGGDENDPDMKRVKVEVGPKQGNKFRSQADWISYVEKNFMEVICGGSFSSKSRNAFYLLLCRVGHQFERADQG